MSSKIYINAKCRRKYATLLKEEFKSRFHPCVFNTGEENALLRQSITWITTDDFSPRTSDWDSKSNMMSFTTVANATPNHNTIKRRGKRSVPQKEHYTRSKKPKLESPYSSSVETTSMTATPLSSVTLGSSGMVSHDKQTSSGIRQGEPWFNRGDLVGLPLLITVMEQNDNISSLDDPEVGSPIPDSTEPTKYGDYSNDKISTI
jgi:hypothetical protein